MNLLRYFKLIVELQILLILDIGLKNLTLPKQEPLICCTCISWTDIGLPIKISTSEHHLLIEVEVTLLNSDAKFRTHRNTMIKPEEAYQMNFVTCVDS